MAELLILGSSAGVPTVNRHSTSMAIKTNGRLYLMDCGGPVSGLLKRMGEDPKETEAVFLTHWHADHASGLPMFIQDLWITQRKKSLIVYGPEGTERKVKLLQNIFILPPDIYPFELSIKEYTEDTVFEDELLKICFFKTGHLSQDRWKVLDDKYNNEIQPIAYGLIIYVDGKKIVVSGDMHHSNDMLPVLSDANVVIHEFGHFHPEAVNHFVREQEITKLIITHIHHDWDDRTEELRGIISNGHSGEVHIAHDLMRLEL